MTDQGPQFLLTGEALDEYGATFTPPILRRPYETDERYAERIVSTPPRKHPGGRPSLYDPAFCDRVVAYGKEGMSPAEIASRLGCVRNTLNNWRDEHPEFLTALHRASEESLAWWEGKGRTGVDKGAALFNAALWKMCMSGRFPSEPYRERVQLTGKDDGPIQHEHDLSKLTDAELAEADRIAAKLGIPGHQDQDRGGEGSTED
jgi:hypothetical protein